MAILLNLVKSCYSAYSGGFRFVDNLVLPSVRSICIILFYPSLPTMELLRSPTGLGKSDPNGEVTVI